MCAPLPFQIVELLPDEMATVKLGNVTETVTVEVIDDPRIGDFLILHGKVALTKIDPDEALEMLARLGAEAALPSEASCAAL